MSGPKAPAAYSRAANGTRPKSRICRLTSSRSLIPSIVGNIAERLPEVAESISPSPSRSSTSPRRSANDRKSPRRYSEERQQAHQSPKHSPRRFLSSSLDESLIQDEMGVGIRISSTTSCVDEPGMSFLEFETLYTLEKELLQSRCNQDISQVNDKSVLAEWFGGRKGVYTELPDPFGHQIAAAAYTNTQMPVEGFSFAPGWSLNADHFYQWQHRGKTTQQVVFSFWIKFN